MGKEIYPIRVAIPLTQEQKDKLKKIAEREALSMNQLVRFGIELIIKKYDKKS